MPVVDYYRKQNKVVDVSRRRPRCARARVLNRLSRRSTRPSPSRMSTPTSSRASLPSFAHRQRLSTPPTDTCSTFARLASLRPSRRSATSPVECFPAVCRAPRLMYLCATFQQQPAHFRQGPSRRLRSCAPAPASMRPVHLPRRPLKALRCRLPRRLPSTGSDSETNTDEFFVRWKGRRCGLRSPRDSSALLFLSPAGSSEIV